MHIVSLNNEEFPRLLTAWISGKRVGRYWKDDQIILVTVTSQYVLAAPEQTPQKLAVKPVRNMDEAESVALTLIHKEELRGSEVEIIR
jgi:hypothetical protein